MDANLTANQLKQVIRTQLATLHNEHRLKDVTYNHIARLAQQSSRTRITNLRRVRRVKERKKERLRPWAWVEGGDEPEPRLCSTPTGEMGGEAAEPPRPN